MLSASCLHQTLPCLKRFRLTFRPFFRFDTDDTDGSVVIHPESAVPLKSEFRIQGSMILFEVYSLIKGYLGFLDTMHRIPTMSAWGPVCGHGRGIGTAFLSTCALPQQGSTSLRLRSLAAQHQPTIRGGKILVEIASVPRCFNRKLYELEP